MSRYGWDVSETFTKLFGSITQSTIWSESNEIRIVWITMLALADRNGYVGASVPGLAASARVSVKDTETALARFLGPDKYSRSKEYEGRRIEVADRGWVLLNYDRFRDMRDEEARKEYERKRKREQRAKARGVRDNEGQSRDVPESPAVSAQADVEAEGDPDQKKKVEEERRPPVPTVLPGESSAASNSRNLRQVLERGLASPIGEDDFVFKDATRLVANEKATIDEVAQALAAWNSGKRPAGVEKLKMFQAKTWPKVRKACLASETEDTRSVAERLLDA